MTRAGRLFLAAAAIAAALAGCGGKKKPAPPAESWIEVAGQRWHVMLAADELHRQRGLGGVSGLPEKTGMLFIFHQPESQRFWMKDCKMALDIAFVDEGRKITQIVTLPAPDAGERPAEVTSEAAALYVLETPAGGLQAAGVKVGDTITFGPDIPARADR